MPEHTIAENLTRLQNAKTAIGNAITAKGGTVAASDGLEEFAADIATIVTVTGGHEVTVTTIADAVVTLEKTGTTYTATADNNGIATFTGVAAGTYTVTAVYDGATSDSTTVAVTDFSATENTFATISITASDDCTITITDGTITKTVAYLAGATVVQYASVGSTWDISTVIDETTITRTVAVTSYADFPVNLTPSVTYGFFIDSSVSDSDNAVTYLEDAVDMTPASMGASTFNYGSWEDAFFMPKPCMLKSDGTVDYYLDPNDYSKKVDGTASDIANSSYDGNAMMEFPKIWYKFAGGTNTGDGYFYVSNTQVDSDYHCWCNIDANNNEIDHFYMAIYNGTGTSKLRSLSGVTLNSSSGNGNTTATQETTRAQANNPTDKQMWYIDQWCDRLLINALLVLMSKSLNSQGKFGQGIVTGSQTAKETYVTGSLNTRGLFYGDISGQSTAVKVFGIENWWGLAYRRTAGCINASGTFKVKLTWGTKDGSTTTGYNEDGSGYISNGSVCTTSNYIQKMKFDQFGYMVNTVNSNASSTYYQDYYYYSSGTKYLLVGGNAGSGSRAGAFFFELSNAPSSAHWSYAAALSCKPLA
jgi:hypothetical protein